MLINCGPSWRDRVATRYYRLKNWHRFFALWPRRITRTKKCAWLQYIERKGDKYYSWTWEYRLIVKEEKDDEEQPV